MTGDGVLDALRRHRIILVERSRVVDQHINLPVATPELVSRATDGVEIAGVGDHEPDLPGSFAAELVAHLS